MPDNEPYDGRITPDQLITMKLPEKGLSKREFKKIKKAMDNIGNNSVMAIPYLSEPLIPIVAWNEEPLKDPLDYIKSNICGGCGTMGKAWASFCIECGVAL
ncbi:hypothetical protein LCGC14_1925300 [marine sediment metagenome]|uniref:Uncharacterized protein n=1 Tax=marine sediment metagenome TaxID=412755 RepID=A0A0F9FQ98_9ZZZZ